MTQDRIEREVTIAAPPRRVWSVITEPEHVAAWFGFEGKPVELDELAPGGRMVVDHGEHGVHPMRIETVDPPRLFAWRWVPYGSGVEPTGDNSTLVEFFLDAQGDGTLLRIVETGFAGLPVPDEVRSRKLEENTGGWTEMAQRIRRHTETGHAETGTA